MFPFRVRKDNKLIMDKLINQKSINKYILNLIENDINPGILTIKEIKERILPILKKHQIFDVYLFGSYSRGDATKDSDVDIYCESGNISTLFEESHLINELKEVLQKEVDVIFFNDKCDDTFLNELNKDKIKLC